MPLERRIREGADRNAAILQPNVEGSFSTVVREARRRRRLRLILSSLVTISFVATAIVFGPGILEGLRTIRTPAIATQPKQIETQTPGEGSFTPMTFDKTISRGLAVVRANGLEGSWGIAIDVQGRMRLLAPAGFDDATGSWLLDPRTNEFRTSAFSNGLCAGQLAGTYRWTRISRYLILDMVRDHCDARVWLLTSGPWTRS
jgi:hypothetical protein